MDLPRTDTHRKLQLLDSRTGAATLKAIAEDECEKFIHSCYDPVREAESLVARCTCTGEGIIVVLGLGLGYHVAALAARFPTVTMIVVEALPECVPLARQVGLVDFDEERLTCLAGFNPDDALQEITERQISGGMPPLSLFTLPAAAGAFPDYYRPLQQQLEKSVSVNLAARLRYRKFRDEKRRVLLFDSGYFLTREVATALERSGCEVARLQFSADTPIGPLLARLAGTVATFRPDFCLTINHLGFDEEGIVTRFLESIELPAASWFVDSPELIVKGYGRNASPFTALFVWDTIYLDSMRRVGFDNVSYLPLGTDPELFRPLPSRAPEVARLAADVGFIGNSMTKPVKDKLSVVHPSLHGAVASLARRLSADRMPLEALFTNLASPLRQCLDALEPRERLDFEAAVTWQATLLYRQSCIARLHGFHPVIHGDNGWHTLLDDGFSIAPPLDYYRELPFFYNACTVNFNATNLQMGTAVNQRLFDVPACGGFLVTDHQESVEELFTVGKEIITYRDPTEIPDLIRYYLGHPSARDTVARRGRERVLRQHTYRHRLQALLQRMTDLYA